MTRKQHDDDGARLEKADLTALEVNRLAKAKRVGRHRVSDNLYLQVKRRSASWLFRYMIDRNQHWMGIGKYRANLAEARGRARQYADLLDQGIDPLDDRREQKTAKKLADAKRITFGKCAEDFLASREQSFKNSKHAAQWHSTFEGSGRKDAATKLINDLPVSEIDLDWAKKVLAPIWHTIPETASRVRQRCAAVIDYAAVHKYCAKGDNPFVWKGNLDKVLAKTNELKKLKGARHQPALPYAGLATFMTELRRNRYVSARALEFLILTATRTGEVIGARWDEINLTDKTWTIPAERTKTHKVHVVPLSDRALEILSDLPREDDNDFVFVGGQRGQPLSNIAMLELVDGMNATKATQQQPLYVDPEQGNAPIKPHGFRSTFRDWAAETTAFPHDVVEMALAHIIKNKAEAAYRRGDLLAKRRQLMAKWAEYCAKPATDSMSTIPLRGKAS